MNKRIRNQDSSLEGSWRANMRVVLDTAESWYNDQTFQSDLSSLHTYKRQYREGVLYPNGTPLQYSCLEKPMARGAWWAVVHRVTKSQARLSDFTFTFHFHALEIRSDQISHLVVSDSLQTHESQHARPPCPSPTPGVHSDSRPSSQWCHPAISPSVIPFSSCPNPSQHQSFPMSQLFSWGGQSTGVSALASFLPKKSQGWSPNGNRLQCSCLENPRDGGAWWAAVFGVAQSRTQLKRLSSSSSSRLYPNIFWSPCG